MCRAIIDASSGWICENEFRKNYQELFLNLFERFVLGNNDAGEMMVDMFKRATRVEIATRHKIVPAIYFTKKTALFKAVKKL